MPYISVLSCIFASTLIVFWGYIAGADLHVHEGAIVDVHWLIKNATYDPHCFMCTNHASGSLAFHFFDTPPSSDSAG